jgi:hypothetical protein
MHDFNAVKHVLVGQKVATHNIKTRNKIKTLFALQTEKVI